MNQASVGIQHRFWAWLAAGLCAALSACGAQPPEHIEQPTISVEEVEKLEQVVDTSLPLVQQAYSIESEEVCDKQGGKWEKVGRQQAYACVPPANDAGNACNDSSECEVACVTENNKMEAGQKASGVCLETTDLFGCRSYVSNGVVEHTLCVD
ncbi:hypothetical protein FJN14_04770 [Alteromonas mediterranea]|uniref:hypothetical protein n=1 Tax=Alteromonas mediterranea TaxID=314275 RepID=UPI00113171CE|nr:hypothetical protein [Alteromonas mediterranea]QDG37804.1 hypothetical protein FJN14_04770 [Alteromonas mediterranea]